MICTEKESFDKVCERHFVVTDRAVGTSNAKVETLYCVGSKCMKWEWCDEYDKGLLSKGYCALAR